MTWLLESGVIVCLGLVLTTCGPQANESIQSASPNATISITSPAAEPALIATPSITTTSPISNSGLSLQEQVKRKAIVFYTTQRDIKPFPLLTWPELAILNRPELSDIYGKNDGTSPLIGDMIPQLNPTGSYLIIPGIGGYGPDGPREMGAGTWLVNLNTGEVRQLWQKGVVTAWSPDGTQLAYVENDTLYVKTVTEKSEALDIFTKPGLWKNFISWSPNGQWLAVISSITGPVPDDGSSPPMTGTVWLVSPQGNQPEQLGQAFPILPTWYSRYQLQWSPDSAALLVGIASPQRILTLSDQHYSFEEGSRGLAWVPQQSTLLVQKKGGAFIANKEGQELVRVTEQFLTAWTFSDEGRYLAYSYSPSNPKSPTIFVFDLIEQETIWSSSMPQEIASNLSLHWTPTDPVLIIDDGDHKTPIWAAVIEPEHKIEVLIEQGLLIRVIPRPAILSD